MESDGSEKSRLKVSKFCLQLEIIFSELLVVKAYKYLQQYIEVFSKAFECHACFSFGTRKFFLSGIFQLKNTKEIMLTENC